MADCHNVCKHDAFCLLYTHASTRARARAFNSPLSGTTRVSRYQKGKTNLDFTEARDSDWQWHQLGHMQVCNSLQTNNHASTPPLSFFTGRMPFLLHNQQCQSNERFFLLYFINIKVTCTSTALLKSGHIIGADYEHRYAVFAVCLLKVEIMQ